MRNYSNMTSFWFYEQFLKYIYSVAPSEREKLIMKVIEYGTEGTSNLSDIEDPVSRAVFPQIKCSIEACRKRHLEAVANGKKGGRPRKIWSKEFVEEFQYMLEREYTPEAIAKHFRISLSSVYRNIKRYPIPKEKLEDKARGRIYFFNHHRLCQGSEIDVLGFDANGKVEPQCYEDWIKPVPIEVLAKWERERVERERVERELQMNSSSNSYEINGRANYEALKRSRRNS